MLKKLISLKQKRSYLLIGLVWILLWLVPWGKLPSIQAGNILAFLTDMIRLGVALLVFIFPGTLFYILVKHNQEEENYLLGIIPIGFTFSVLIIGLVGLIGRVLGVSFQVVKYSFASIGLIELISIALFKPNYSVHKNLFKKSLTSFLRNSPLIFALALSTVFTFHDSLFFIDDTTYLAYLTNWQFATQLGFKNIVHEIDAIEHFRYWLAMYPMGQALLADLSGLPGLLLLGSYLELFLVPIAGVTAYWFARVLGLSRMVSGFAVLTQVTIYVWMMGDDFPVGMWFYQSLSEDKVTATFILAPVFFVFGLALIQSQKKESWLLFITAGLSLTFTHPVVLFFASCIVLCVAFLSLVLKKIDWRKAFQLVVLIVIIMLPYMLIRVSNSYAQADIPHSGESASTTYQIERYTHIYNEVFYGLNLGVLKFSDFDLVNTSARNAFQVFRLLPILIVLMSGIISFINLKKGVVYLYVLSCILLIAFATIPFTGWILGYFVSARLISRSSWFSPIGLSAVLVLNFVLTWFKSRNTSLKVSINNFIGSPRGIILGLFASFIFSTPWLLFFTFPRVPLYFQVLDHNKQLARIGDYIDHQTDEPVIVIALDYTDTQYLPGISSQTRLISFREEKEYNPHNHFLTSEEIQHRTYASNLIRSTNPMSSAEDRCNMIVKFNVRFILAEQSNAEPYTELINVCDQRVNIVLETKDLILLSLDKSRSE